MTNEPDTWETLCAMFVPPSIESKLTEKIISVEEKLRDKLQWKVKVLEQSGIPLAMTFIPKFELLNGCPKGDGCMIRECGGIKCAQRRVVYRAVCRECKKMGAAAESTYIGETCRPLRERAAEHRKNILMGDPKSFQLIHWMEQHGTSTTLPEFEFKVLASFGDALRRQLCEGLQILHSGTLNRKVEFNSNVISRLEVPDANIYHESWLREKLEDSASLKCKIGSFISVMSNVIAEWPESKENKKKCSSK